MDNNDSMEVAMVKTFIEHFLSMHSIKLLRCTNTHKFSQ